MGLTLKYGRLCWQMIDIPLDKVWTIRKPSVICMKISEKWCVHIIVIFDTGYLSR